MAKGIRARLAIRYPGFELEVDLQLPGTGVSALFGPSGSGKSSLLRAMAGLERPGGGFLEVNDELWQDDARGVFVPAHRRAVGYVFQEASLFTHLNVRRNLEYGLKRSGGNQDPGAFANAVDLLEIGFLLNRSPERLSGGERQRVAIARALLARPRLLLFDEPLAALDLKRRSEILPYLERVQESLQIPSIYVSHSADEVARLADHLVLLDHGKVIASGRLQDTLARLDLPVELTANAGVMIEAVVAEHDSADHLLRLEFPGGSLFVPDRPVPVGHRLRCRIDARDVSLTLERQADSSILNLIGSTISGVADTDHPAQLLVRLDADGTPLLARVTRRSWAALELSPGKRVWAQIKAVALIG